MLWLGLLLIAGSSVAQLPKFRCDRFICSLLAHAGAPFEVCLCSLHLPRPRPCASGFADKARGFWYLERSITTTNSCKRSRFHRTHTEYERCLGYGAWGT